MMQDKAIGLQKRSQKSGKKPCLNSILLSSKLSFSKKALISLCSSELIILSLRKSQESSVLQTRVRVQTQKCLQLFWMKTWMFNLANTMNRRVQSNLKHQSQANQNTPFYSKMKVLVTVLFSSAYTLMKKKNHTRFQNGILMPKEILKSDLKMKNKRKCKLQDTPSRQWILLRKRTYTKLEMQLEMYKLRCQL